MWRGKQRSADGSRHQLQTTCSAVWAQRSVRKDGSSRPPEPLVKGRGRGRDAVTNPPVLNETERLLLRFFCSQNLDYRSAFKASAAACSGVATYRRRGPLSSHRTRGTACSVSRVPLRPRGQQLELWKQTEHGTPSALYSSTSVICL
ncbi:hypothetical protein EYF80_054243 [Liparis tanakae]|uniref:Uncharacterized protein n=1 Tax=Liparis tanakae TaxID=230148 RepID=A0A4Z2F530_9TELE|nr:hypothetical protein EYF80_054243 [Liparis tanakae]